MAGGLDILNICTQWTLQVSSYQLLDCKILDNDKTAPSLDTVNEALERLRVGKAGDFCKISAQLEVSFCFDGFSGIIWWRDYYVYSHY